MEDEIFKLMMELKRISNADTTSIIWTINGLKKQPIMNFIYAPIPAMVSFKMKDVTLSLKENGYEQTINILNREINRILSNLLQRNLIGYYYQYCSNQCAIFMRKIILHTN